MRLMGKWEFENYGNCEIIRFLYMTEYEERQLGNNMMWDFKDFRNGEGESGNGGD